MVDGVGTRGIRLLAAGLLASASVIVVAAGGPVACATYRDDLGRVRSHYDASEFPQALALLRVLGDDLDALTPTEQVAYAYYRGMTDYRLSEAAPSGDTRDAFRKHAEKYLIVTGELDRRASGLSDAQRARVHETLAVLEGHSAGEGSSATEPDVETTE